MIIKFISQDANKFFTVYEKYFIYIFFSDKSERLFTLSLPKTANIRFQQSTQIYCLSETNNIKIPPPNTPKLVKNNRTINDKEFENPDYNL